MPPAYATRFQEAIASDRPALALAALRDRLAEEIAVTAGKDLAPLATVLLKVLAELENQPTETADPVDELAKRRENRRKAAGF